MPAELSSIVDDGQDGPLSQPSKGAQKCAQTLGTDWRPHTEKLRGRQSGLRGERATHRTLSHIAPTDDDGARLLIELVELLHAVEDRLLRRLLHLAREEELVEDHVDLVEVEDEVELAHVAKELVEELDEEVDRLEVEQLVVGHVDAQREEEARVPPVDELVLRVL